MREDLRVADIQSADEMEHILARLQGKQIASLQVLGINSLKSVTPAVGDLVGLGVTKTHVADREVTITTSQFEVVIDLQRTGRLVWLEFAEPYQLGHGPTPTARLLVSDGTGVDLTEPAKTKRITVSLTDRAK